MRKLLAPLLLVPLLAGCTDSLGISSRDCSSVMTQIRRNEGRPPDNTQGPTELEGDFEEVWFYAADGNGPARRYSFRWGVSVQSCEANGPSPVTNRVPEPAGPISMRGDGGRR